MYITCDKCNCQMDQGEADCRQEWKETTYYCDLCQREAIHRTEYDQIGLVTSDEITYVNM